MRAAGGDAEGLDERAERPTGLELVRRGVEDLNTLTLRLFECLGNEPCFADPRFALDQDDLTRPTGSSFEAVEQDGELGLPSDERNVSRYPRHRQDVDETAVRSR